MRDRTFNLLTILSIILTIINAALFVGHVKNNKVHIFNARNAIVSSTNITQYTSSPRLIILFSIE
jgi:hypothetical protein